MRVTDRGAADACLAAEAPAQASHTDSPWDQQVAHANRPHDAQNENGASAPSSVGH